MNYIYLAIGLVVGAVFLGMAKNTRRRKAIPVTFVDTNLAITNIIAIISLIVFVVGYIMRIVNNKKHLNHFFVR